MIWNEHYECMDREKIRDIQGQRLCETVDRVYHNVPFYRTKMQELGLEPGDIKDIDDIKKLPFTTKQDLRDNYPFGLFATPKSEVVRVHASSGTTGKPTVVGYSRRDIATFAEIVARSLNAAGASKEDIVQIAYGYGLFTGGLGLHYGAEKIGATVIPISGGNTQKQLQLMQDFNSTVLACTPSYALYLAETMQEKEISPESLKLKIGILGAEPWTKEMRQQIEKNLSIKAFDIYGLSEIMGPGVANDCEYQDGLHVWEDHFVPEIINPDTLQPVSSGIGELVFTTITKEALPLLRYRTRDLTQLNYNKCACGRTAVRMEKCTGRSDDMIIIRGVNVFPSQVESVLLEMGETKPHYLLIADREGALDTLEIWVEVDDYYFSDEIGKLEALTRKIKGAVENLLGVTVKIKLVEPKTIQRSEGKAQRVIDKRKL